MAHLSEKTITDLIGKATESLEMGERQNWGPMHTNYVIGPTETHSMRETAQKLSEIHTAIRGLGRVVVDRGDVLYALDNVEFSYRFVTHCDPAQFFPPNEADELGVVSRLGGQ